MGFLPACSFSVHLPGSNSDRDHGEETPEKLREKKNLPNVSKKLTDMFWAVAGPSSAPMADDSGGGGVSVIGSGMHSEESEVRVEPAVSTTPLKTLCPLIKLIQKLSGGQTVDDNTTTIKEVGKVYCMIALVAY